MPGCVWRPLKIWRLLRHESETRLKSNGKGLWSCVTRGWLEWYGVSCSKTCQFACLGHEECHVKHCRYSVRASSGLWLSRCQPLYFQMTFQMSPLYFLSGCYFQILSGLWMITVAEFGLYFVYFLAGASWYSSCPAGMWTQMMFYKAQGFTKMTRLLLIIAHADCETSPPTNWG